VAAEVRELTKSRPRRNQPERAMTDPIVMYDTCSNDQFPAGAPAYAAYVDGNIGDQPNYAYIVKAFPSAEHLAIALNPAHDAEALDVENGAAQPSDIPGWYAAQVARGIQRPVVYASASTMQSQILRVLAAAGISRAATRLWSAHYGAGTHICGPSTCGQLNLDADGTQWTPNALGRDLDGSLLLPGFFSELPTDWTYSAPLALAATGGHSSVRLQWQPPQGSPALPAGYLIWIYRGTGASKATLVPSYPRTVSGALQWQGGSLEPGTVYTAHVAATGPDGTRMRPYGFAAVSFTTAS
jgi:hypothetical protein